MPLLFLMLFGIIDYGLWFNDSLSVRQGIRESARMAVVQHNQTGSDSNCPGATFMANVACGARSQIVTSGGVAYAKVSAPNGWARGKPLLVCGMVKANSFTHYVPLPADGLIKSKTTMSIEKDTPMPTSTTAYSDDATGSGGNWSWCTP
jgi:Flp pilus assembly protein TadG